MKLAIRILLIAFLAGATAANAAGYRVDLEANPAAAFPFLSRFGKLDISVYSGGVSAKSTFLEAYSRNRSSNFTVKSPYSRMFADVPLSEIRDVILLLSQSDNEVLPGLDALTIAPPLRGTVRGISATRYRIILGADAWLDVWTTTAVPGSPQFQALQMQFVSAISRSAARTAATIPGMPVYVELKTRRFDKVPLLRLKKIVRSNEGEAEALSTGSFYMRSPIVEFLLK